jgi:DNA repair protein RadA/Sms
MVETIIPQGNKELRIKNAELKNKAKIQKLSEASKKPLRRLQTEIEEIDRVLGGGIVPGSVILLAGDPGIGKSTLVLQIASLLHSLYIAGEESVQQVKLRYDRLGLSKAKKKADNLYIIAGTDVDQVVSVARENIHQILIADSIQTMITEDLNSAASSVGQVREVAYRLHRLAKETGTAVFIIGHVTKEGSIAGPKVLEHLVDTVLYLQGEQEGLFRLLSASKNRYGNIDEIGVFEMGEDGMKQVKNPSQKFLSSRISAPGSIVVPVMEGSRALLTEIQALTNQSSFALPVRRSLGIDNTRLQLLTATLSKRAGVFLGNQDVFVNIAGGLQVRERGVDLGVCLAIASSVYDKVISKDTVAMGEVGLLGEIRTTPFLEKRLTEARKLGFKKFITSKQVKTLREAVKIALGLKN